MSTLNAPAPAKAYAPSKVDVAALPSYECQSCGRPVRFTDSKVGRWGDWWHTRCFNADYCREEN